MLTNTRIPIPGNGATAPNDGLPGAAGNTGEPRLPC